MKKTMSVTREEILAHLQSNPGQRYEVGTLATKYGVREASMRDTLDGLARQGRIMRTERSSRVAIQYYAPGEVRLEPWTVRFRELKPDPILMERVRESKARRARFPSRFD